MEEENKGIYLKGYKEGFESALKMCWSYAEELLIKVDNENKEDIKDFINRLVH